MTGQSDKMGITNGIVVPTIKQNYRYKEDLKQYIYDILSKYGPLTRAQLVAMTGIPRTTIYDILDKLILMEKVNKFKLKISKKGRPTVYYEIVK